LDCKFLAILGQFQKRVSQLLGAGGCSQFGTARCALTAFFGVAGMIASLRDKAGA
jgi:hypothetical protein